MLDPAIGFLGGRLYSSGPSESVARLCRPVQVVSVPREFWFGVCRNSTIATMIGVLSGPDESLAANTMSVEVHVSFRRGGRGPPPQCF